MNVRTHYLKTLLLKQNAAFPFRGKKSKLNKLTAVLLSATVSFHWHPFSIYFLFLQAGLECKDIQTLLPRLPLALLSGILQE